MVKTGDRVRLSSTKGPHREGVVTAVTGSLLRLRWPSGEETTVVPAPGTLTVLSTGAGAQRRAAKKNEGAAGKREPGARKKADGKGAASKSRPTKKTKGS